MAEPQNLDDLVPNIERLVDSYVRRHTRCNVCSLHVSRERLETLLTKILDVLQRSTIANVDPSDTMERFWKHYRKTAEEVDSEFMDKYGKNIDISMILVMHSLCSVNSSTDTPSDWSRFSRLCHNNQHDEYKHQPRSQS